MIPNRIKVGVIILNANVKSGKIISAPHSSYVRLIDKLQDCSSRKIRYDFINSSDINYLRMRTYSQKYNFLLIQRNAIIDIRLIDEIISLKIPIVYEIDDDLVALSKSSVQGNTYHNCHIAIEKLLSYAKVVTVSTEVLKNRFSKYNNNVIVLPNQVNIKRWCSPVSEFSFPTLSSNDFNVLYMGTNTHQNDLLLLEMAVKQIKKKYPNFKFYVVGVTDINSDWFERIEIPTNYSSYPEFVKFVKALAKHMHLGVAPLEDGYFQQAKSCLKFLEYSALGLPSICSNVTPYKEVIKHGENGLLADNTTKSWFECFEFAIQHIESMTFSFKCIENKLHIDIDLDDIILSYFKMHNK